MVKYVPTYTWGKKKKKKSVKDISNDAYVMFLCFLFFFLFYFFFSSDFLYKSVCCWHSFELL